jgi:colanic acid/amylovoran biosynthesis glycosyltransferase
MENSNLKQVAIFRREFLPISETFILDHIDGLRRWCPTPIFEYRSRNGLFSEMHPAVDITGGLHKKIAGEIFARFGISPQLTKLIRERRIQLIHAHFLTDATRILEFARTHNIPLVVTAHGYDATKNDEEFEKDRIGRFFLKNRRRLIDAAAAVFCVSDFIREQLIERGGAKEKLITQRLGIDLSRYREGRPAGVRSGVLFAGRLVEKKGARYLIEAWTKLPRRVREQGLTIIGEGPERETLQTKAKAFPEIRFLGAQSRSIVRSEMLKCRLFALPSIRASTGDSEGLPIVAMEAQALGTPLVVFNDGPMIEAIRTDVSGLVAAVGDIQDYATALERILTDDHLASRLGAGGVQLAAERYDIKKNTELLETHYDRIVGEIKYGSS